MTACLATRRIQMVPAWLLSMAIIGSVPVTRAETPGLVVLPESSSRISALLDDQTYLDLRLVAWEKNWKYLGFRGSIAIKDGASVLTNRAQAKGSGADISATLRVAKSGPRRVTVDAMIQASKDTALTYIVLALDPIKTAFDGGQITTAPTRGKPVATPLPLGRREIGTALPRIALLDGRQRPTSVRMDPACDVSADGAVRIVLAAGTLRAGQPTHTTLTIDFPAALTYYAGADQVPPAPDFDQWYPFQPDDDYDTPSVIGMEEWLEKPAGKHGRIGRRDDQLVYAKRPIKLWGINVCYSACAPDKPRAEKRARFYARYGINAVRLHKYADGPGWSGIQSADSFVQFDPEGLDRMDYQFLHLAAREIRVASAVGQGLGSQGTGQFCR